MFALLFAKWAVLPSWLKTGIGYGAIVLLALLLLRWYGNRQYSEGKQDGRVAVTKDMEKKLREEIKAELLTIQKEKTVVIEDRKTAATEIAQNAAFHDRLNRDLNDRVDQIIAEKEAADAAAHMLVPSKRVDAIRALSGELASVPSPVH